MSKVQNRLAEDALALVRIPSVSGRETAVADWVENRLRDLSPAMLTRHGNALAAAFGGDPRSDGDIEWVALAGHLDTVPQNGQTPPKIENGILHGLGATDMKGALAVMLNLARDFNSPGGSGLVVVFYDCEEVAWDQNGLRTFVDKEPWLGSMDAAILMEPTNNFLELGCLGTLHAEVTFHGEAAHSARPWTGDNAVYKAAPFLEAVANAGEREYRDGPAVYKEVINVTTVRAGIGRNVIPDKCVLNVNFRFPADRTEAEARDFVTRMVPPGAGLEITDLAPAAPARMDSPLLKVLAGALPNTPRAKQAWTDVAQFAALGVPAANFGPGIPELAHKVNESIPVENLVDSYSILSRLLSR